MGVASAGLRAYAPRKVAQVPLQIGDPVQRYVVERVLSKGADFLVRHSLLGSLWRLTVLRADSPSRAAAMIAEAGLLSRLEHPNVLRTVDCLDIDGQPAVISEYTEGQSLEEALRAGLSAEAAAPIARGVLRGLRAAHALGLAHGALGIGSVWVGARDRARLMGFSIGAPKRADRDILDAIELLGALPGIDRAALVGATSAEELYVRITGKPMPADPSPLELPSDLPAHSAPSTFPRVVPSNLSLPQPRRALIGRSSDLERVFGRLMARPGVVTLVGTPGVGKTRLALEVAHRYLRASGAAVWVDLQASTSTEDALAQIAWVLGETADGTVTIARSLGRRGAALLVLDNVEQLLDLPEEGRLLREALASIGSAAPELRVLFTSRQPTEAHGEQVFEIRPLSHTDQSPQRSDAWRLLLDAAPRGSLDGIDDAAAVALLDALEGVPLCIELAAGRLEVLQPEQLLERIRDRFVLLSAPEAEGRYRGLLDALAASFDALPAETGELLAKLSVFVASFDLPLVHEVTGVPDADEKLDALVRRSLALRVGSRFVLLASVREFAAQRLADKPAAIARHARALARIAERHRIATRESLLEIEQHAADLAAVLDRAEQGEPIVEEALAVTRALALLHHAKGPLGLSRARLDRAIALEGGPLSLRSELMLHRAAVKRLQGDVAGALSDARWVLDRRSLLPDEHTASAYSHIADQLDTEGRTEEALAAANEGCEAAARSNTRSILATLEASAGGMLAQLGRVEEAKQRYVRALQAVPLGDLPTELQVWRGLLWFELLVDDLASARRSAERVTALAERLDQQRAVLTTTAQIGIIAEADGRLTEADTSFQRAAEGMVRWGDETFAAYYRGMRGRVALRRGDPQLALSLLPRPEMLPKDSTFGIKLFDMRALTLAELGRPEDVPCSETWRPLVSAVRRAALALAALDRTSARSALAEQALPEDDATQRAAARAVLDRLGRRAESLWIARDGRFLEPRDAPRTTLGESSPRARILAYLLALYERDPEAIAEADALVAAGWPKERILQKAANNRLHVALSELRRAAGSDLIEHERSGWRLKVADIWVIDDP